MTKPQSKATLFSIWVAVCASIGIILGLADGKSIKAGIAVAAIISIIMVVGFLIVTWHKKRTSE